MAFRLTQHTPLAEDLRRRADTELGAAIDRLLDHASPPGPRVHAARKAIKRVRALLRLVRAGLPPQRFRAHNLALGDAARGLSATRDAAVALATFDRLVPADDPLAALRPRLTTHPAPTTPDPHGAPQTDAELTRPNPAPPTDPALQTTTELTRPDPAPPTTAELPRAPPTTTELTEPITPEPAPQSPALAPADPLPIAAAALASVRTSLAADLDNLRFAHLAAGLKDSYGGGRRALRASLAAADADDETFHAWRKRAKDLWYQCQLLQGACPPLLGALEGMLDELGERLGDDHDLAVLQAAAPASAELDQRIAAQHHALREAAWRLGRQIYAERPRAFVRRVQAYWQAWRREPLRA